MAQDILITPGSGEPQILFRGSGTNDTPIELNVLSSYQSANGSGSALLFEGTEGQLFAITDNLSSGVIFSVAGAAGLPFIEADASGDVRLIEYGRYVGVGTGTPAYQLDVFGTGRFSEGILFADGNIQTGAYTGDGGGGGTTYTAGSGLTLDGTEFNIYGGTGNLQELQFTETSNTVRIGYNTSGVLGSKNIHIGYEAGQESEFNVIAIGTNAGNVGASTNHDDTIWIGREAGFGIGFALLGNGQAIGIGYRAFRDTTSVYRGVAIGDNAGANITSVGSEYGWFSTYVGALAGESASGNVQGNTSIGYNAGGVAKNHQYSTQVGYSAGSLTSGQYSTYLGAGAGRSVVGSNNVEVRAGENGSPSNSIIGSNSNKIHVYNTIVGDTSSRLYAIGNVGSGNLTPDATLEVLPAASTDVGLIVQGATSQSANLQEWQDSAGTELSIIDSNGIMRSTDIRIYSNASQYSSGDYEYANFSFNGSEFQLDTTAGGTGTTRNLKTNTTAILLNANSEIQNSLDFDCRSRYASFQDGTNHITLSPNQQATFFNGNTYRWVSQARANRGGTSGDVTRMTLNTTTAAPTLTLGVGSIAGVDGGYQVVGNGSSGSRNYLFAGQWTAGENDSVYYSNLSGSQTDTCDHASYVTLGITVFNVDYTGNISGNSIQFRDGTTQTTASTPGGSDTNIQFNNGGTFSGESNFTWNYNTDLLTVSGTSLLAGTGVVLQVKNTGGDTLFAVEDTNETTVVVNAQVGQTSYPFEVRDEFGLTAAYVDVSGNVSGNSISFGDGTTQTTAATASGPASVISDTGTGITMVCGTHANNYLRTTSNSAVTITFPSGLGCDANSEFTFEQAGSGQITVTGDAGVTINTSSTTKSYTQFSVISMKQVTTDTYTLFGDTASF